MNPRPSTRLTSILTAAFIGIQFGVLPAQPCGAAGFTSQSQLRIRQVTAVVEGETTRHTAWGEARLDYLGASLPLYLNVNVNGDWQIQNVPVMSPHGVGIAHRQAISFDLGVDHGVELTTIDCGYMLTPFELQSPPPADDVMNIGSARVVLGSGYRGALRLAEPGPFRGGPVGDKKGAYPKPIINQQCGAYECAPAAVSNALQTLARDFQIPIDPELISIEALKRALAYRPRQGSRPGGVDYDWPALKARYLEENDIPIRSTMLEPGQSGPEAVRRINRVSRALEEGAMVELTVDDHTMLIESVTPHEGTNNYTITIVHDKVQANDRRGTVTETISYNASTQRITGLVVNGRNYGGHNVRHFTVQKVVGRRYHRNFEQGTQDGERDEDGG